MFILGGKKQLTNKESPMTVSPIHILYKWVLMAVFTGIYLALLSRGKIWESVFGLRYEYQGVLYEECGGREDNWSWRMFKSCHYCLVVLPCFGKLRFIPILTAACYWKARWCIATNAYVRAAMGMQTYVHKFQGKFSRAWKVSEDFKTSYFVVADAAHRNVRGEAGSHWYPEKCVAHESVLIKHMVLKS